MNERIGQLAEEAALLGPTSRIGNSHEATEKFAHLIIRECIELNRQELSFSAFARMLDKYNEHFGVEQ
jgi:hypothetical protein